MKTHLAVLLGCIAVCLLAVARVHGDEEGEVCAKYCGCGDFVATGHRSASNCATCHVTECSDAYSYCQEWAGPYNDHCEGHKICGYLGPCDPIE